MYLFSWRSVAHTFTGANETLLNFIKIVFFNLMITLLKQLHGQLPIANLVYLVFSVIFVGPRKRASAGKSGQAFREVGFDY